MNRRNFIKNTTAGLAFAYLSLFGLKEKEEDISVSTASTDAVWEFYRTNLRYLFDDNGGQSKTYVRVKDLPERMQALILPINR